MADDLRGEAVAVVRVGWRRHPSASFVPTPAANPGYRDNAGGDYLGTVLRHTE
jgi:hypothetical protein